MSASSEFVALCKSQVGLLTQGLGSSLSVVYLAEELVEGTEAKLIPIVAYPDTSVVWEENPRLAIPASRSGEGASPTPRLGEDGPYDRNPIVDSNGRLLSSAPAVPMSMPLVQSHSRATGQEPPVDEEEEDRLVQHRQIVLPLLHDGVVMGLLVTSREDRGWTERERAQIERIAHTIAIACILDRRQGWFGQQVETLRARSLKQKRLEAERHDLLDSLLHQLRSPLTALRTFGKLLLKRLIEPDPNRDIASSIVRESDRVQELLLQMDRAIEMDEMADVDDAEREDYLTLTSERQSPQLLLPASHLQPCFVSDVLEPLLLSARAIALDRDLQLYVQFTPQVPLVRVYPTALREVLSNLIDNALKYTPAGGQIYIKVGDTRQVNDTEQLAIAISDTGPGIPAEDLEHLFERYFRGVKADTDIPGTGLGLAIARDLVRQMQGEIEVFSPAQPLWLPSNAPGTPPSISHPGTTFVVWLPVETGDSIAQDV